MSKIPVHWALYAAATGALSLASYLRVGVDNALMTLGFLLIGAAAIRGMNALEHGDE